MSFKAPFAGAIFVVVMGVELEDIVICADEAGYGGLSQKIWYALPDDFEVFELPRGGGFSRRKSIRQGEIVLQHGKKLKSIDVYLEQNSLTEKALGGVRRWKNVSEFAFSILGMKAKNLGYVTHLNNIGLIFLIPDSNGTIWVFGTPKNTAYLSNYEATTGKKWEDDALVNLNYTAHTGLYCYEGSIEDF